MKDKTIPITDRMDEKSQSILANVSPIPEMMKVLNHTNLDQWISLN